VEILQAVVEQERIDFPFVDGNQTTFDAVFVHQDDHVLQVVRQHVGLIAGRTRIQQERCSVGDNARRIGISVVEPAE
jgi:hypothetical protein